MNILHVNNVLPVPPMDGGRLRKLQHLGALESAHHLRVLGRCPDPAALAPFVAAHPLWQVLPVPEPVDPSRNPIPRAVREALAAHPVDVVHVSGFGQWPGERGLGRAYAVLDIDSLDGVVLQRMREAGDTTVSGFHVSATDALTRAACERADLVLACSEVDAAALRALAPSARVAVIDNGVDVQALDGLGPIPETPPLVTFTGFLAYWPNADACTWFADEVLPRLRDQVPGVRFRIVGRVPPASVVALAERPGIELHADVPSMRPHFAEAHVLVAPLRAGSGTRLKILEGFAAGRPIVSTSIGCEGLPVVDGEHLRVADDPARFADAVAQLLRDREAAAMLAARARQMVAARFDLPVLAERLLDIYASLRGTPPRGVAPGAQEAVR
jgi:glycosyltransferase involved in cell wall biosynthesis